jgi:hypothetical protein
MLILMICRGVATAVAVAVVALIVVVVEGSVGGGSTMRLRWATGRWRGRGRCGGDALLIWSGSGWRLLALMRMTRWRCRGALIGGRLGGRERLGPSLIPLG